MRVAGGWRAADLATRQAAEGRPYLEFERERSMSVGLYVLAAGELDHQQPHTEDEVYVVLAGRSRFTAGDEMRDVMPGDVIFVSAGMPPRFHQISAELRVLVVFAP